MTQRNKNKHLQLSPTKHHDEDDDEEKEEEEALLSRFKFEQRLIKYCERHLKGDHKEIMIGMRRETTINILFFAAVVWLACLVNPKSLGYDGVVETNKNQNNQRSIRTKHK